MEQLTMSNQEIDRLKVIQNTIEGRFTWAEAAAMLARSPRHIGRLCARVRLQGNRGIIHGLKGRPSNHHLPDGLIEEAIAIVKRKYADFGPTFACEKLEKKHKITISVSALRKAMIEAGLYSPKRQRPRHRKWRERCACVGMMIQLDGSEHDWFEGRAPKCALLIFIDDATSRIMYGRFITVEDTVNLMTCVWQYLRKHGRPLAFYVDKDSIYKVNREANVDEELRDETPLSQFTRAMGELDIRMIFANSPQAKGRVERGFRTHQDRLVKELRLAGISDMASANKFLEDVYIPEHNKKFAVAAAGRSDAHRRLLPQHKLDGILCTKVKRTVGNDYTIRYRNKYLQLGKEQAVRIRPRTEIYVEERLDGTIKVKGRGAYLQHTVIAKPPYRGYFATNKGKLKALTIPSKGTSVPGKDHPWIRFGQFGSSAQRTTGDVAAP